MDIIFIAIEDIKKGDHVSLNIDTGELSKSTEYEKMLIDAGKIKPGLQPKEQPNIIEKGDHRLDDLLI